ncbi:uncharacterized protein LOC125229224 [Leguminivora glycinivorella]|uniref:uncharacterized protein LOC125229224 n=1 Tax=Leguminivora glycinivorella TaxID=1035111 RepID=UPI00200C2628|nr:uncharacterized protein LOC125229224 [Leguminivora glycinivorella]XP_047989975.1 uncharacterized protein LOC125229224 [Leguminivora glycinivorella]
MWTALQRFGLRHHELPALLRNAAALLRVLALDLHAGDNRRVPVIFYVTSAAVMALYVYTYHVSTYWFIWRGGGGGGGGERLFVILQVSLSISSCIGVVKLLYMYLHSGKVKKLVSGYLACDAAVARGSRMRTNVNATLRTVKKRAIIFWLIIIGNGVVYVGVPLVKPGRHLTVDGQILLGLEPMYSSPRFELANVALWASVFLTVYAPANISGFFIVVVGYSEAQMLALAQELLHLWDDAQQHYKQNRPASTQTPSCFLDISRESQAGKRKKLRTVNEYVTSRLVSIIKCHATNISLINQVQSIFRSSLAMEFTLLTCGLIAELLGGLENTFIQVPFSLAQVSMDCLTGQNLMDANKALEEAAYACGWERMHTGNRRLVLALLQNAQRPLQLSAGGVATLGHTSLMAVFKSIYSAYTALRRFTY